MEIKYVEIPKISDVRWSLSFMEVPKDIPFEIKRIYYIYDLKEDGNIRWEHAHRETEQIMFCLNGSVTVGFDDGENKKLITLDSSNKWVHIPKMIWHWMEWFSENCIILVIASHLYEETDYIRNYENYISILK